VDWRNIGGATEIMRYLTSEFTTSFRAWWTGQGKPWRGDGGAIILNRSFDPAEAGGGGRGGLGGSSRAVPGVPGDGRSGGVSSQIDMYFGGGAYDGDNATRQGLLVPAWGPDEIPPGLLATAAGEELIPDGDERRDVAHADVVRHDAEHVRHLLQPRPDPGAGHRARAGTVGGSGRSALVRHAGAGGSDQERQHRQGLRDHRAGGVPEGGGGGGIRGRADDYEARIAAAKLPPGEMPEGVPAEYQQAVEAGWVNGVRLIQRIGANARYFTDSGSKVPLDVGMGNAAAGLCIDFYGRFEAQVSNGGRGNGAMAYVTPRGESGVSADPISLLRGAPHRETARRFIEFLLSEEGQKLWCYRVGAPGGPRKYALQRFPIRRDFYPSANPAFQVAYERHRAHTTDDLGEPTLDAYRLARNTCTGRAGRRAISGCSATWSARCAWMRARSCARRGRRSERRAGRRRVRARWRRWGACRRSPSR
jgi:iron(III) transport system substrate-binding protein